MTTHIEYELEDSTTLLIESPAMETGGLVKATRGNAEDVIVKAHKKFGEAPESIRTQALAQRQRLEDARADEVEMKFALKTTGEVGNFAIGSAGAETAYEMTLIWKIEPKPLPAAKSQPSLSFVTVHCGNLSMLIDFLPDSMCILGTDGSATAGTGFIVSADGSTLTCSHVVRGKKVQHTANHARSG
jgi:hypothetical protein